MWELDQRVRGSDSAVRVWRRCATSGSSATSRRAGRSACRRVATSPRPTPSAAPGWRRSHSAPTSTPQ
eukprot:1658321-Rhodomonas_salina.1